MSILQSVLRTTHVSSSH